MMLLLPGRIQTLRRPLGWKRRSSLLIVCNIATIIYVHGLTLLGYRHNPKVVAAVVLAWPGWVFCVVRYVYPDQLLL